MRVVSTSLPGVVIVEPRVHEDSRGFFLESFHEAKFGELGLPTRFVQDNHSRSAAGTLRGLHYQLSNPQGKLVRCVRGSVFDVAADIRLGSPTFGKWVGVELSEENKRQLYVPPGFAHGFCVANVASDVLYKCTTLFDPSDEYGVAWDDPLLNIAWPVRAPLLSDRDSRFQPVSATRDDLPNSVNNQTGNSRMRVMGI